MNSTLKELSSDAKIAYLILPILTALQEAGGRLERQEIQSRISDSDEQIAEFASIIKKSKTTGNLYREFNFKFNFAIKNLSFLDYLKFTKGNPTITLTEKGLNADLSTLDVDKDIMIPAKKIWDQLNEKNKNKVINDNNNESSEEQDANNFEDQLLNAIANMSPKKFEAFCRLLLTEMGIEFTNEGIQISNDGGIDGYGYHTDKDNLRTTRVVIQCKRYNTAPVGSQTIDQFLGAINKFKADYGIFITNSRFTPNAKNAAKQGSPITLIDGNKLVELVIKYQLYITPVTTYILDDFYND